MESQDVFQQLDDADEASASPIVERLEMRGRHTAFVAMRDRYVDQLAIASDARVLELGCGTGVVARSLAAREGFRGQVVGSDYSPALIAAAQRFAVSEGVDDKVRFEVEDAQETNQPDNHYDAVILHTLVSHVPDPTATLGEAARSVKAGRNVAVFDGDYASLAYFTGSDDDADVVEAILGAVVANPTVMRALPAMLTVAGLSVVDVHADVLVETGDSPFFTSMVEAYLPIAVRSGRIDDAQARDWMAGFKYATQANTAFASCNYVTYITRKV